MKAEVESEAEPEAEVGAGRSVWRGLVDLSSRWALGRCSVGYRCWGPRTGLVLLARLVLGRCSDHSRDLGKRLVLDAALVPENYLSQRKKSGQRSTLVLYNCLGQRKDSSLHSSSGLRSALVL